MTATFLESTPAAADPSTLSPGSARARLAGRLGPSTNADRTAVPRRASRVDRQVQAPTDRIQSGTRLVFVAFAAFTLLATNQLLVLAAHTDRYFAWTIQVEPTAAFLGAAYAAGFVLSVLGLRRDRWGHVRVAMVTVTAFTVITLAATVIHSHKLHLSADGAVARFAAWVWLAVYIVIPVACLAVVGRQQRRRSPAEPVRRAMPGWLMATLGVQGVLLFVAGVVLFTGGATVHHHVTWSAAHFWPWPLTPLAAQTIGAWLIAFGVAAALAIWERDLNRLLVPAVAYTAFGVFELLVVLRYRAQVGADDPRLWAYVAVLAMIIATGAYGSWAARRPRSPDPRGDASVWSP